MSEAEKEAGEGGFLSRWSRRKRAAVEAPEAPPEAESPAPDSPAPDSPVAGSPPLAESPSAAATEPGPGASPTARAACPIPEIPEVDPASLPPVESLTAQSDFGVFLKPGVPTLLRNAALRRMWSLDPAIRDYIGPVDYQWDFNTPGGLPFGFANELTGDVSKLLAQAIGKLEELAEDDKAGKETAGEAEAAVGQPAPEAADDPPAATEEPPAAPPALVAEAPAAPAEPPPVPRRRHGGALPA